MAPIGPISLAIRYLPSDPAASGSTTAEDEPVTEADRRARLAIGVILIAVIVSIPLLFLLVRLSLWCHRRRLNSKGQPFSFSWRPRWFRSSSVLHFRSSSKPATPDEERPVDVDDVGMKSTNTADASPVAAAAVAAAAEHSHTIDNNDNISNNNNNGNSTAALADADAPKVPPKAKRRSHDSSKLAENINTALSPAPPPYYPQAAASIAPLPVPPPFYIVNSRIGGGGQGGQPRRCSHPVLSSSSPHHLPSPKKHHQQQQRGHGAAQRKKKGHGDCDDTDAERPPRNATSSEHVSTFTAVWVGDWEDVGGGGGVYRGNNGGSSSGSGDGHRHGDASRRKSAFG